jgi:DNA-binding response OmpR family regulator
MEFPQIILFIGNDHDRLESSIFALEQERHIILSAADGNEGLIIAQRDQPDLIISEFELSDMSGIELCQRLRENEEFSDVPVILINEPDQNINNVIKALREGADDYLSICCDPRYLVTKILCHLDQIRTKSSLKHSYQALRNRQTHINEIITRTAALIKDLDVEYRNTISRTSPSSELETSFGCRIESGIKIVESLATLLEEQANTLDVLVNEFNGGSFNDEKISPFLDSKNTTSPLMSANRC